MPACFSVLEIVHAFEVHDFAPVRFPCFFIFCFGGRSSVSLFAWCYVLRIPLSSAFPSSRSVLTGWGGRKAWVCALVRWEWE